MGVICGNCEENEAKLECAACESSFCEECDDGVHKGKKKSHQRSPIVAKQLILCENCEETEAVVSCEECEQSFCDDCEQTLHKNKKKAAHTRTRLDGTAGPQSPRSPVSRPASSAPSSKPGTPLPFQSPQSPRSPAPKPATNAPSSKPGTPAPFENPQSPRSPAPKPATSAPSSKTGTPAPPVAEVAAKSTQPPAVPASALAREGNAIHDDAPHPQVSSLPVSTTSRSTEPPVSPPVQAQAPVAPRVQDGGEDRVQTKVQRGAPNLPATSPKAGLDQYDEMTSGPMQILFAGSVGSSLITSVVPGLYEIMGLKHDTADLSLVEKVIISRAEIYRICNDFAPSSCREKDAYINFAVLNDQRVFTVGMFGNKLKMLDYLKQYAGFPSDGYAMLAEDPNKLPPGLYAWVNQRELVYLMYWPSANGFREVSRKNVTTNFLRYLTEVCDHMLTFFSETEAEKLDFSPPRDTTADEREIFGSVEFKKATDDDVMVHPGFRIPIPKAMLDDVPPELMDEKFIEFAPGLVRRALHSATKVPVSKTFSDRVTLTMNPDRFSDWVEEVMANYNLAIDPTVPQDEVVLFLKHASRELFREWEELQAGIAAEQTELQQKLESAALTSEINEESEELKNRANNAFWAILRQHYGKEERTLQNFAHHTEKSAEFSFTPEEQAIQNADLKYFEGKMDLELPEFSKGLQDAVLRYKIGVYHVMETYKIMRASELDKHIPEVKRIMTEKRSIPALLKKYSIAELTLKAGLTQPGATEKDLVEAISKKVTKSPVESNHKEIVETYLDVYFRARREARNKLRTAAVLKLLPSQQERIRKKAQQLRAQFAERSNALRTDFVNKTRDDLCVPRDGRFLLRLYRCSGDVPSKLTTATPTKSREISVSFDQEFLCSGRVARSFRCVDIFKHDMERLDSDPLAVTEPVISDIKGSLELDPNVHALKAAFTLKNGKWLIFVQSNKEDRYTHLYIENPQSRRWGDVPFKTLKKPVELVAFDESLRLLALYDIGRAKVDVYRFDDNFQRLEKTPAEIHLDCYAGESRLKDMLFLFGQNKLVFVDVSLRARVFDLATNTMKPRVFELGEPYDKVVMSPDGSCLCVFTSQFAKTSAMDALAASESADDSPDDLLSRSTSDVDSRGSPPDSPKARRTPLMTQRSRTMGGLELEARSLKRSFSISSATPITPRTAFDSGEQGYVTMSVFLVETMKLLKAIRLSDNFSPEIVTSVEFLVFGPQVNLVGYDWRRQELVSHVVQIVTQQSVCKVVTEIGDDRLVVEEKPTNEPSNAYLDYYYHVFDKFCVRSMLQTDRPPLNIHVIFDVSPKMFAADDLGPNCVDYIKSMFHKLQDETRKAVDELKVTADAFPLSQFSPRSLKWERWRLLGDVVRDIVCLVPIQIARAENNGFRPLCDGLQMHHDLQRKDVLAVANAIRFGLYESVLESWSAPIRVVSSMGKQSTGKSYLLNHLTGSLFDISGGRCTDGVWLTIRTTPDCMYVILDFEGLGSFERSEQEDMLLSVFNASVSNLTLYKTDFRIDKDTAATFQRFQSGVSLIKGDDKLFRGRFYIVVKDVESRDVKDLHTEFLAKVTQICKANDQDNFISKMYQGQFAMSTFPPLGNRMFYDYLKRVYQTLVKQPPSFEMGRAFKTALQIVMAKIGMKDWTPLDRAQIALRVDMLRKALPTVVSCGCLADTTDDMDEKIHDADYLTAVDSGTRIPDLELVLTDLPLLKPDPSAPPLPDTGLRLSYREQDGGSFFELLQDLRLYVDSYFKKRGHANFKQYFELLQEFINVVLERRKSRVTAWVDENVKNFHLDGDVQILKQEVTNALNDLSRLWTLCGIKCDKCYYTCLLSKYHVGEHSCLGTHKCDDVCTYCVEKEKERSRVFERTSTPTPLSSRSSSFLMEDVSSGDDLDSDSLGVVRCGDIAGHAGAHDCRQGAHTCGHKCHLSHLNNCNKICVLSPDHTGDHVCNALQHLCGHKCSLATCPNACIMPYEVNHSRHVCHETRCPHRCPMPGCTNPCSSNDHFHGADNASTQHLCPNPHACPHLCEHSGVCEITSQLIKEQRTFHGKKDTFQFDWVTEQNSVRKRCCKLIPANHTSHGGAHTHTDDDRVLHYCDSKCPACGYVCNLPWAHTDPLHRTDHGNMRNCFFVSEDETVDVGARTYAVGETGEAEMCNQYCRTLGRGHIHLIYCPYGSKAKCMASESEGIRHETTKYGPDVDRPKDELTHVAYWKSLGFADPCLPEEQAEFALCPYECSAEEHQPRPGQSDKDRPEPSYCSLALWHKPMNAKDPLPGNAGFISSTGHHFRCSHTNCAFHTYFIVDRSASMNISDARPTIVDIKKVLDNRLGAVFESCHRFILTRKASGAVEDRVSLITFAERAKVVFQNEPLSEKLYKLMLKDCKPSGNTCFSAGIKQAGELLAKYRSPRHRPLFIFLTDGTDGNQDGPSPSIQVMHQLANREANYDHTVMMHTIKFGTDLEGNDELILLARIGRGSFFTTMDEVQLIETFENISATLRHNKGGLIRSASTRMNLPD